MRPAKFEYFDPHTIGEALNLLKNYGEEAEVLAGGLSLVPTMKLRLATPKYVIDITKIPTLSYVIENNDGGLSIGALTTYQTLIASPVVQRKCPILPEIANGLGGSQVRNRGTLGGNLCHGDPACDFSPAILALNADLKTVGPQGERIIKASDFFVDFFTTSLKPSELLTEIRIPPSLPHTGEAYLKLTQRSGDFAMVSAAVVMTLDARNICKTIGVGLGAVAPTPMKAEQTEKALLGKPVTDKLIEEAAKLATKGTKPSSDIHASSEYRMEMIPVITKRALKEAFGRAGGAK